jgi:hypothetical protein
MKPSTNHRDVVTSSDSNLRAGGIGEKLHQTLFSAQDLAKIREIPKSAIGMLTNEHSSGIKSEAHPRNNNASLRRLARTSENNASGLLQNEVVAAGSSQGESMKGFNAFTSQVLICIG